MTYKKLEEKRKYAREWMKLDREKNPDKYAKLDYARRTKNPAKRLIQSTRQTAKKKGLEHTITEQDLNLPDICPYLKVKIDYRAGVGKHMYNPSVDRKDSSKGYTPENIEVMSTLANTMKSSATKEQLIEFAKTVLERNGYLVI